jgi:hypothetical protein
MAQVDHVVDARAKEFVGGGAGKHHGRTPRKQPLLDIKLGVQTIGNHPRSPVFMRGPGILQGRLNNSFFDNRMEMNRFLKTQGAKKI